MTSNREIIGLALVLLAVILILVFTFQRRKRGAPRLFRTIPAFVRLRSAIGLAVEEGKRLHVSLGRSSIIGPNSASALIGLSALERVAQLSIVSDRPPLATSGEGTLAILSQDTLKAAYRESNALDQYDPARGRLTGPTDFSYIAGAMPVIQGEEISTNLLIGNFGPQVGLLTEASDREKAFSIAASDALPAQAVLFAASEEVLIGEELFAIPAYLQSNPAQQASIRAQDILRWVIVAALVLGSLVKLITSMFGIPLP